MRQCDALCRAIGMPEGQTARAKRLFDLLTDSWSAHIAGEAPPWPNDICDDGSPFEFSVAFEGGLPRFRLLAESQQMPMTPQSSWEAGKELCQRLGRAGMADLTQLEKIQDLFQPSRFVPSRFSMWHAAVLGRDRDLFKVYLNPHVLGTGAAPRLVERALDRLGLSEAWEFLRARVENQQLPSDVRYFALDLEPKQDARVKIYIAQTSTAEEVDRLIQGAANVEPGDAVRWLSALTNIVGHFQARPVLSCFAFRRDRPKPDVTLHVPVRSYVENDAEALEKVTALLSDSEGQKLRDVVSSISRRSPEQTRGVVTYASLTRTDTRTRVTVYLAPQIYSGANATRITLRPPSLRPRQGTATTGVRFKLPPAPGMTMRDIQLVITRHLEELENVTSATPGRDSEGSGPIERRAPHLTFAFLCFRDIVRLALQQSEDPEVRAILTSVERDHGERARSYMTDLERLGATCTVVQVFSQSQDLVRDTSYALASEVLRAESDYVRLAVAQCVDAASAALIGVEASRAQKDRERLSPCDSQGQPSESPKETQEKLASLRLPDAYVGEVLSTIERSFRAMGRLFAKLAGEGLAERELLTSAC